MKRVGSSFPSRGSIDTRYEFRYALGEQITTGKYRRRT